MRYAADFMDLGVGVRELAMGSTAALARGGSADWWNASRLSSVRGDEIGLHHTFYGGGLASLDYAGYARPLGGAMIVSVSVLRFAVDAIPRYDQSLDPKGRAERESNVSARPSGDPSGYFDAQDLGFRLSLARRSERIVDFGWLYSPFPLATGFGGSIKYISQSLDDNIAVGLGGDLGAHVRIGAAEMIGFDALGDAALGVALIDIAGTQITWDTASRSKASLPMRVRLDLGYSQPFPAFSSELNLTWGEVWDLQDGGRNDKGMGAEWSFKNMVALRVGEHRGDLTAGAGFRAWKVEVDYAFLSAEALENHRIDLTFYPWD
ncbi:MAG: hypothetical protein CME06_02360 [Gemmatimonadetes bacterium]|nr:hypothetical protein [Gemmatimonadota bacterium]